MDGERRILQTRVREWRRALASAAALLSLYLPLELHYGHPWVTLPVRLAWIAFLLLVRALLRADRPRILRLAPPAAGLVSGICGAVIIACTGGSQSPRFGFLLAYPLAVLMLAPDLPLVAALMGLGTLGGGTAILLSEGRDPWYLGEWLLLSVSATGLAVVGAVAFRRLWVSELDAQRARARALAELADAQHLAVVGRLASVVAHELNNPLAVVMANVGWLRGLPEARGLGAEVGTALDEAAQCTQRIARIVADMGALSRKGAEAAGPCALEGTVGFARQLSSARGLRGAEGLSGLPAVWAVERRLALGLAALLDEADASGAQASPSFGPSLEAHRDGDTVVLTIASEGGPPRPRLSSGLSVALAGEHLRLCGATLEQGPAAPGAGARFTVRLRVASAPWPEAAEADAPAASTRASVG